MTRQITVGVADLKSAMDFYDPLLATIGFAREWSNDTGASYARIGTTDKVVLAGNAASVLRATDATPLRVSALNRTSLEAFHLAGRVQTDPTNAPSLITLDGTSAAVVVDPDGNALEAVYTSQTAASLIATAHSGASSMAEVPAIPSRAVASSVSSSASNSGPNLGPTGEAPLLDIQGLKTHFKTDDGFVKSVDGVDIAIHRGETAFVAPITQHSDGSCCFHAFAAN